MTNRYLVCYKASFISHQSVSADNAESARSLVEEALSHSLATEHQILGVYMISGHSVAPVSFLKSVADHLKKIPW